MNEKSQCPLEVENAILEILRNSALLIRSLGWNGKAEECALLADHIHNLPSLLQNYKPELLDYYWTVERTGFLYQAQELGLSSGIFKTQWERIEPFVTHSKTKEAASSLLAKAA